MHAQTLHAGSGVSACFPAAVLRYITSGSHQLLPLVPLVLLQVLETEPIMPGEDFSFFTRAVPSTFMFLGIKNETVGSVHNLHNANFKIDEGVLPLGAAMHASLAMEYLSRGQEGFGSSKGSSGNREEL
jgi:hypothetical protein